MGRLDLDHVGAEIGEQLARVGGRNQLAALEHPQPRQCLSCHARRRTIPAAHCRTMAAAPPRGTVPLIREVRKLAAMSRTSITMLMLRKPLCALTIRGP